MILRITASELAQPRRPGARGVMNTTDRHLTQDPTYAIEDTKGTVYAGLEGIPANHPAIMHAGPMRSLRELAPGESTGFVRDPTMRVVRRT